MKRLHLERLANPQLLALVAVLLINWLLFPDFFRISWQDGRLFGSLIDVLNRGAPVAILAIGMTAVIATKGVDLSVGAIMAVCGAVAATMVVISSELDEVVAYSSRIVVMRDREMVAELRGKNINPGVIVQAIANHPDEAVA